MRVFHVLDHSLPHLSGYAIRSHNIIKFQMQQAFQPYVMTSPKQGPSKTSSEQFDNIEYLRMPFTVPHGFLQKPYWHELHLLRQTTQAIWQQVKTLRPQILHAHSPVLNGWPAYWVARYCGLPLVYEVRAFWEDAAVDHGTCQEDSRRYRMTKGLETLLLKRADQIVTLSQSMRAEITSRGIAAEKIQIVSNAVDITRFTEAPPRPELVEKFRLASTTVFGFIGSFYHYEGLDFLIAAFEKIYARFPQTRLLLVGDGFERQHLETVAAQSQARAAITFTGAVNPDKVIDYYNLMDVLVYPRRKMRLTELVCPLKPLEAMALGKCVVGSDIGGIREFIVAGETGLLARPDDADDLAGTLSQVIIAPELRRQLGQRGREAVLTTRDWPFVVSQYKEIYERAQQAYLQKQ